jgi:hypothetical protein
MQAGDGIGGPYAPNESNTCGVVYKGKDQELIDGRVGHITLRIRPIRSESDPPATGGDHTLYGIVPILS